MNWARHKGVRVMIQNNKGAVLDTQDDDGYVALLHNLAGIGLQPRFACHRWRFRVSSHWANNNTEEHHA